MEILVDQWANYKHLLKTDNPFYNILRMMIQCRLLPYRTVDDIYVHRVDYRLLKQMKILHFIRVITFLRFWLISFGEEGPCRILLLENFKGEPHQRALFFALDIVIFCPAMMYYISFDMLTKPHRMFRGLYVMAQLSQNFRLNKTKQHAQFCLILNISLRVNLVIAVVVTCLLVLVFAIDTYQLYGHHLSPLIIFLALFWTIELCSHVIFACIFGIFWFQFQCIVIWHLQTKFILLCNRLNVFKQFFNSLELRSKDMTILKLLRDLDVIVTWSMTYTNQSQMFIGTLYYVFLIALDSLLLILIDPRTQGFVQLISFLAFLYAGGITATLYLFYSNFNCRARQTGFNLQYFLFRRCHISFNLRMKICEIHAGLMSDQVGVRCADVFVFNRLRLVKLIVSFVTTFFLIIQVFRGSFDR